MGLSESRTSSKTEKAQPSYQAHDRAAIRGDDFWRLAEDAGIVFGPSAAVLLPTSRLTVSSPCSRAESSRRSASLGETKIIATLESPGLPTKGQRRVTVTDDIVGLGFHRVDERYERHRHPCHPIISDLSPPVMSLGETLR
jgi:hypothetical protein